MPDLRAARRAVHHLDGTRAGSACRAVAPNARPRRHHRLQKRQRHRHAHALQDGAARQVFPREEHRTLLSDAVIASPRRRSTPCGGASAFAIRNAGLLTTPRTNDDMRLFASGRVANDRAHGRHVRVLDAAADGVGHQVLGEAAEHHVLVTSAAPPADPRDRSSSCRRRDRPTTSTGTSLSLIRQAPVDVEVLEREARADR